MVTRHPARRFLQVPETAKALLCTAESGAPSPPPLGGHHRRSQVQAAETRLLYENGALGIVVTIVIALLLAYAQWAVISRSDWCAALHAAGLCGAVLQCANTDAAARDTNDRR